MKRISFSLMGLLLLVGCSGKDTPQQPEKTSPGPGVRPLGSEDSLREARKGFKTKLRPQQRGAEPVDKPPLRLFNLVRYDAPLGMFSAYLTPDPKDGKKHPAIVWITGGDCNSIDKGSWTEGAASNDQSASGFRKAGIVMMFPSLRGGNDNPGQKEGFFGEVDDVLAAAEFLAKQEFVDPNRIYLGGHSTGGTLVMLAAAASDRFRAVFSFGPADDVSAYPPEYIPFDTFGKREVELRSPNRWLHSVKTPLFVFEGTVEGNLGALEAMKQSSTNPKIHFHPVKGATHFSILAPTTRLLAAKVLRDEGAATNLAFTEEELNKPFGR